MIYPVRGDRTTRRDFSASRGLEGEVKAGGACIGDPSRYVIGFTTPAVNSVGEQQDAEPKEDRLRVIRNFFHQY